MRHTVYLCKKCTEAYASKNEACTILNKNRRKTIADLGP
jgi:hypothetical protein